MVDRVILASGSPRRKELLTLAGVSFEVRSPEVDETPVKNESGVRMVRRLSLMKAHAIVGDLSSSSETVIVVAADTTVVSPRGEILSKPEDRRDALRMIRELQGRPHRVLTGYSVVKWSRGRITREHSRVIQTRVWIESLTPARVAAYVDRGESMDKAGAYAAQGYGMAMIERIDGSYTNVVGLPMTEVMRDLRSLGWRP